MQKVTLGWSVGGSVAVVLAAAAAAAAVLLVLVLAADVCPGAVDRLCSHR